MQLSAKVDLNHTIIHEVEKKLSDLPKIHKTLSKSFAMQRKTLVKVLGLEGRVGVLESQQAAEEQAQEGIDEILSDLGEESQEGDVIIPEVLQDDAEIGGDDKSNVITLDGEKKPPFKVNRRIIKVEDIKRGTSQESLANIRPDKSQNPDISQFFGQPRPDVDPKVINPEVLPPEEGVSESPVGEGLKNILNSIAGTTESIKNVLIGQQKADNDAAKDSAKDAQNVARGKQEKKLETKIFDGVKKVGEKVLKPVQGIFEKIWGFVKKVLLADIVRRLFNWLSDDDNKKKVKSIFRFVKDFWPALLTGFLLFGTGIGSLITGTVAALAGFVPTLLGLLPGLLAFLASPIGLAVLGTAAVVGGGMWIANKMKGDDNKIESSEPVKMNKGGSVPGSGNTDTVPAMLTPGEFVLTKEATQKYGTDTLEGMNAAAATGKKETSGIGRGVGSAVGGLAGGVVGFFADSPVSPVADIALGLAGSAAGGEIGDNLERKVRGMNDGGKVQEKDSVLGVSHSISGIPISGAAYGVKSLNTQEITDNMTGETHTRYQTPEEMKAMIEGSGLPAMQISGGAYVPNFGKMTSDSFMEAVQIIRENIQHDPDRLAKLDKFMATNPYAQPDELQRIVNTVVPGSQAQDLQVMSDEINVSTQKFKPQKLNKGGLVQYFNNGGPVQEFKRLKMLSNRIKPGPNGKFSKEDKARKGQLALQMKEISKQINASKKSTPTNNTPTNNKNVRNRPTVNKQVGPKNLRKRSGGGLGRLIGGAADMMTGNLFDFDNKSGGGLIRKVLGGTADALTGNRWDFDNQGKPAQVVKSKPKHTEIAPPSTSSRGSGSKPGVTAINAGTVGNTIDATEKTSPPEVPPFSSTLYRSHDKIKTLGIMV